MARRAFINPHRCRASLIIENAARRLPPEEANDLRELRALLDPARVERWERRQELRSLSWIAEHTSLDYVGREFAGVMGIDAESVERSILRARKRG